MYGYKSAAAAVALTAWLTLVARPISAQTGQLDAQLAEAQRLYKAANFAEAVVKLTGALEHLRALQHLEARKLQLADAHLLLALSYFAMDDRTMAYEHFADVARTDPGRRLDAQVYAPPVIALFDQAQTAVEGKAAARAAAPTPPLEKKGRSLTLPLLLGGGGAAAIGVIVASVGDTDGNALMTNARFETAGFACPGASRYPVVLVDVANGSQVLNVQSVTAVFTVVATSRGVVGTQKPLASEDLQVVPATVGSGASTTLRIATSTLGFYNCATALPGEFTRWKAQVTLTTSSGVFNLETVNVWEATGSPD